MTGPPLPEGRSLDITSLTGEGSAELLFEPGEILPVEATATGHWDLRLISDQAGGAEEVTLVQDMSLTLSRP